ncbi:sugar transferase [Porphyromonas gulae]|uniref:sugar transferase n=1 Tax=Porphyromonas gulae TaxID=111105 RepID=UPI00052CC9E6|nr:sugar transferase [Porphyromonas gulae]KGN74582.1 sugar transferase [Porphyromonas gulae]KGO04750.1 sugar transferase [Porphyromonas gulae]
MVYKNFIKRGMDFGGALAAILVFSPIILLVGICLYIANKGAGAFFIQERPGRNEKIFKLYKFKSMTDEKDSAGNLLPDSKRLTKVGKFIRKTSLDELPQLWNVLRGDMSFIGPRPLLIKYLPLYSKEQARRHEVRPGITGWAQVNGRNAISWDKKFELDIWYVANLNFTLDVRILFLTIKRVLQQKGISSENNATMEEFTGNNAYK